MAIGLKNSEELLQRVSQFVHFAVNEECASMANSEGCGPYTKFLRLGKPVFHIEYAKYTVKGSNVTIKAESTSLRSYGSDQLESLYCLQTALPNKRLVATDVAPMFSTVIKVLGLDGWVLYCDGSWGVTKTTNTGAENVIEGKNDPRQGRGSRSPKDSRDSGRDAKDIGFGNSGSSKQGSNSPFSGMFSKGMGQGFRGTMGSRDED
jgi:hypothetical protein